MKKRVLIVLLCFVGALSSAFAAEKKVQGVVISSEDNLPVSYTHLRAHETGRNLVCRLLLEKKKKKISHIHISITQNTQKTSIKKK